MRRLGENQLVCAVADAVAGGVIKAIAVLDFCCDLPQRAFKHRKGGRLRQAAARLPSSK